MTPDQPSFRFRSDLFTIDPKEDEETNPFCYGRSMAEWICARFEELGYRPEPVIPEDWGWCVMLRREPFMLWLGCGNDRATFYDKVAPEQKESFAPDGRDIVWSCIVGTDVPVWTAFFWKRLVGRASTDSAVAEVARQLQNLLNNEPGIQVCLNETA